MFVIGKDYSREDIHAQCGGNKQAFLPTHQGKVVAACLSPERNPQAPDIVLCSSGAAARAAGRTLAKQSGPIPVFIRQDANRWRFMGSFAPSESLSAPPDCAPYVAGSGFKVAQISRVIKLRRC
ncbi:MAG: DUF6697 family protein [Burkholderiaceae bacterium]